MGGRGGAPNAGTTATPPSTSQEEREFRQWLGTAKPANADMVDDPSIRNKVILNLPDRGAYIDRGNPGRPIVRDVGSDEALFRGTNDSDLYRQISNFYGVQVEFTNERTGKTTMYGKKGNPRTSPAAKKYGVS